MPVEKTKSGNKRNSVASEKPINDKRTGAALKSESTLREDVRSAGLEKVYERHGRIDLNPMPSDDPQDPLNWRPWRKNVLLVLVSIHALMGPFAAAATIPAYTTFAADFGISVTQASYTTSVQILFLGVFPLLWSPVSSRIGRRPVYLASTLISAALALACAYCTSYGTLIAVRILQAIAISPPQSTGAATITEMFFEHERGAKIGVWALLVTLGPPLAPLIFGFVVYHLRWQWIFYILSIIFLVEFCAYVVLGPETLYDRPPRHGDAQDDRTVIDSPVVPPSAGRESWLKPYVSFARHDRTPWSRLPIEIISPLRMFIVPTVFLPAMAYAVTFTFSNVLLTVETPALLGLKYGLNPQQQGLQFIAYLIGAVTGEPIAGYGSDALVAWRSRRSGRREPEYRLPVALPGFILVFIGILVFSVQLNNTANGQWSVTPIVGGGIAMFGLQLITTVCLTYAIESQAPLGPVRSRQAAIFVTFWRQLFAFTLPFYAVISYEELGFTRAGALYASLSAAMSVLILLLIPLGQRFRKAQYDRESR